MIGARKRDGTRDKILARLRARIEKRKRNREAWDPVEQWLARKAKHRADAQITHSADGKPENTGDV